MAGEMVFTVQGATAVAAEPIGLADAGLRERDHLQEWVIANPRVLGPDVMVVDSEFGQWTGATGERERDRLDVLGLHRDGQLVVVELKRDKAPDTVDMQALKYTALVSRFTRDDLDKVHAAYLTRRGGRPVGTDEAAALIDAWATVTEETLRLPSVVLMATEFPPTVTATVVFLHQQLGLDVRLLAFQAYRTANDVLLTVSQHYPPPGIEEFVLSPEVSEAREARAVRQTRQRESSAVGRLIEGEVLTPGERLEFRATSAELRDLTAPWLDAEPGRRHATWQDDPGAPLTWEHDGAAYSPTGLARHILAEAAGRTSQVQGPLFWVNDAGSSLVELAAALPAPSEVPVEQHVSRMTEALRRTWEAFDAQVLGLGDNVGKRAREKAVVYYARRKLCDLLVHGDHLSVYVRGIGVQDHAVGTGTVVGGKAGYVHAHLRDTGDVPAVVALLREAYLRRGTAG